MLWFSFWHDVNSFIFLLFITCKYFEFDRFHFLDLISYNLRLLLRSDYSVLFVLNWSISLVYLNHASFVNLCFYCCMCFRNFIFYLFRNYLSYLLLAHLKFIRLGFFLENFRLVFVF